MSIKRLVNNFSPVLLALEAEVFSCTLPVILFFVDKEASDYKGVHSELGPLAYIYDNQLKFLEIDSAEFFKITEQFEIVSCH